MTEEQRQHLLDVMQHLDAAEALLVVDPKGYGLPLMWVRDARFYISEKLSGV